ncbi:MAG: S9 family peptidase [Sphingomonadaceae bacterium]|nr:S9 family peptidase [Sphingomonadaceae bacterium]
MTRIRLCNLVAAAALLALAHPAVAQQPPLANPAEAFGARESITNISLSPDGRTVVYLAPGAGRSNGVFAVDLATGTTRPVTRTSGDPLRFIWCDFSGNDRLVCQLYGVLPAGSVLAGSLQLVSIDTDGENPVTLGQRRSAYAAYQRQFDGEVIDWLPEADGSVLMSRVYVPEVGRVNTRLQDTSEGLGVDRIDTRTARTRPIEAPRAEIGEYMTDQRGNVRISGSVRVRGATGMLGDTISYRYRVAGESEWRDLDAYNSVTSGGFQPLAIDAELNAVYGLQRHQGRDALHRISLDGSMRRELVFAHDSVDVGGVLRLGRAGRVIGVTFAEDTGRSEYFDEEYAALARALSQALPGLPLIRFESASDDESVLLIWAGGDTDPGRYYTYTKATRALNEIALARPQLEHAALANVRPVRYQAADGTSIPAYLTMPPGRTDARGLPAIVMPHGGPSVRDVWGFEWLPQYFAHRGYAVLQPNYRGSAGYGQAWFVVNGFQGWRTAIGDINAGGRWLVAEGIANPDQLAILGWSYGGYAALQSGVLDPGLFKAIVAVAPVTDLGELRDRARLYTSGANEREMIGEGPHIRAGSPAQNAGSIVAPVLMFHGARDINVDIGQSRLMRERLRAAGKEVELIEFETLEHSLDDSAVRAQVLARSDVFLSEALDLPAPPAAIIASASGRGGEPGAAPTPTEPQGPAFPGAVVPEGAVGTEQSETDEDE